MRIRILVPVALAATMLIAATGSAAGSSEKSQRRTGTIAFLRLDPGPDFGGRLFIIRPDGTGLRQLTPPATAVYAYAWSPNGRLIAYIDRQLSLWLVRPDGSGRKLLLPTSELSTFGLSWSPNGKKIAIASPGRDADLGNLSCSPATFAIVPIGGARPNVLPVRGSGCDVAWSPRGNEIAFDHDGISVIHPDGTGLHHVPHAGGMLWSADGKQLAFGTAIRRNGNIDRYTAFAVVNVDGTHAHVVTTHAYNEYGVAWSPQGRRIIYGHSDGKGIYVIGSDGRHNRQVTPDQPPYAGWGALAWSPHGRSIAYTAGGTDNTDLYVVGLDGRSTVQLTNTPDDDIDPSWVGP